MKGFTTSEEPRSWDTELRVRLRSAFYVNATITDKSLEALGSMVWTPKGIRKEEKRRDVGQAAICIAKSPRRGSRTWMQYDFNPPPGHLSAEPVFTFKGLLGLQIMDYVLMIKLIMQFLLAGT